MRKWLPVLVVVAACSGDLPANVETSLVEPGLRQYITLESTTVQQGGVLHIHAALINRSERTDTFGVSCRGGLGLQGIDFVDEGGAWCEAIDTRALAPGDSIWTNFTTPVVTSRPGNYALTVRQFISLPNGTTVQVKVVEPDTIPRQASKAP